jgi:hypothetical protein
MRITSETFDKRALGSYVEQAVKLAKRPEILNRFSGAARDGRIPSVLPGGTIPERVSLVSTAAWLGRTGPERAGETFG